MNSAVTLLILLQLLPPGGALKTATATPTVVAASTPIQLARDSAKHFTLRSLQQTERWTRQWDRKSGWNRDTQASAYSYSQSNDLGAGNAFTWESAEASSTSNYSGVYYNDDGLGKTVQAGDMASGAWAGAYTKNIPNSVDLRTTPSRYPQGTAAAIASNFDTEMSSQRGPMAISGTYEGSRAVAGSSAWWNAAQKNSLGGSVIASNIDSYGPTPGKPTTVRKGDNPYGRHSVAFTNIAPNSAAQSGVGNGTAAIASGYEVASAARADGDRKKQWKVTIFHRDKGDNGIFESVLEGGQRRLLRQSSLRASRGRPVLTKWLIGLQGRGGERVVVQQPLSDGHA